ncbi:16S rRNA (guanine(966)-N(2))-methyltransferase RsmD [Salisediminibacterium halotolerans]|uniref:16S rRNA (Guanine(966)-N(2))-methyltransferase RsmD n=1 Tax=Salisediminibacterium halotolerans TaxID=517425 RepID=A0A1H9PT26_9BACI|nr:16S rRNA (guanine(966)-N(2))-methyltransferase RsmD [Salisediminibacterium haloalkalitolerans]SER51374.1 16S rRNA (guanine(966)-N(2))-methyltransferase RsmD [Salisediminibacterium haloalkalitolerans]
MRVISGERKGMRLKSVAGQGTRPTSDRVREALFNMIGPYFNGGRILDLFSGSGALSIEALSRGIDEALLVEIDKSAIKTIRENIEQAQYKSKCTVYKTDAKAALNKVGKNGEQFDIVFLDPPYNADELPSLLDLIDSNNLLSERGWIVCEHEKGLDLPDRAVTFARKRTQNYGNTSVTIFRRIEAK